MIGITRVVRTDNNMPCPEDTRWKVNSEFPLHWRRWDDEFVVYNSGSGDTHLLDPVAAEALQNLEQESADLSELVVRVAASLEIEPDTDFAAYLEQLLSDLYKLGLIERIQQ
jgi:PqqD family protein of HPr-rel-A system